jgi:ferredoxin-NADP reductase
MLRHRAAIHSSVAARLLYSSRSRDEIIYRDELEQLNSSQNVQVFFTLTRKWPEGWNGHRRRIDQELLREISWTPPERPLIYVCGPTAFVERAADLLVAIGYDAGRIKTERFGPTGG